MEEAAQNLGSSGFRLFRRIVFPLGHARLYRRRGLVFVKVFDDLATPLLLNVKDMLAPQAYLRVTSIGIADPMGYVISRGADRRLGRLPWRCRRCRDARQGLPTVQRGGGGLSRRHHEAPGSGRRLGGRRLILLRWCSRRMSACCCCRSRRCGRSRRCPTATRLAHYARVFGDSPGLHQEHAALCLAGRPDRRRGRQRHRLSGAAHQDCSARHVAGLGGHRPHSPCRASCIGIGYLRTFYGVQAAGRRSRSATFWFDDRARARDPSPALCAARMLRRAAADLACQLEEAAENLGATKRRTVRRIVMPLMRAACSQASSRASPRRRSNCRRR